MTALAQLNRWRAVSDTKGPRAGRRSLLGGATTRRPAWWTLTLECGHTVKRAVRYWPQPNPRRGGTQHRNLHDALPAPKHVRCEQCGPA